VVRWQVFDGGGTSREGAQEVRAFGLPQFLRGRHARLYDRHLSELRRAARRRLWLSLQGATAASAVLVGAVGLWLAASDRVTLADAAIALGATVLLAQRLFAGVAGAGALYESARFIDDMSSFLAIEPTVREPHVGAGEPIAFREIAVERLGFRYPSSDRCALTDVSLTIGAGEVVALVGENGSGKSTLAKLLARLYVADSGRILWDGVDIATLDLARVRRSVAVVFQDFLRFALTARENVGVGDAARIEDVRGIVAAAATTGIDATLAGLAHGYDTVLAPEFEGGGDLSAGQWQRVALSRAFFRDAPFIILDEPSAALVSARRARPLPTSPRALPRTVGAAHLASLRQRPLSRPHLRARAR